MNQEKSLFNDKKKYWSSIAVLCFLVITTIIFLCKDYSLAQLAYSLKNANLGFIFIGLCIMFLYISCEAINTKLIMASFGQKLSFQQCLKYAFIGFYFCAITPSATGGQPAQIYYMKKDHIPVSFSALTLLINLAIYQMVTLTYGLIFFLWKKDFILTSIQGLEPLLYLGIAIYIGALILILTAIFSQKQIRKLFYGLLKIGIRCKLVKNPTTAQEKIEQQLSEYQMGIYHVKKHPLIFLQNFLVTALQLTCYLSIPYFVYCAFHLSTYGFWDILAIQSVLMISVSALPLPGAIGVSEGSFIILFKLFFTSSLLLPAMLLTRSINFYVYLIISGCIAVVAHWQSQKKSSAVNIC